MIAPSLEREEVRDLLSVPVHVESCEAIKALNPRRDRVAISLEENKVGTFKWTDGDFTSLVAIDPAEAVFIASDASPASRGAWVRQGATRLDVRWFGAKVDAVQGSTGWTGTDDGLAIERALALGVALFRTIVAPAGFSIINNRGLVASGRVSIEGEGSNASGWVFKGTFARTVQTLIKHPDDGPDAPINIAVKLTAAYSTIRNMSIRLDYNGSVSTDYGADIDVGVFVDGVPFVVLEDVRVTGYWRQAGCDLDITKNSQSATLDYSRLIDCWFQGFWGLRIQGAEPKVGNTELLSDDLRGRGGASDIRTESLRLWGMNHHSGKRYSDTDGGCYKVSGKLHPGSSAINAIQGRRHYGVRFQTAEPYAFYVDAAIREQMFGAVIDRSTGYVKTDGVTGVIDADQSYVTTSRTRQALFIGLDVYRATNALTPGSFSWLDGSTESVSDLRNYIKGDLELQGNVTRLLLNETDGAADAKIWNITGSGGSLIIQTLKDDGTFGANAITIARSGQSITSITVNGPCVLNSSDVRVPNLPTSAPSESKRMWVDSSAGEVVKRVP